MWLETLVAALALLGPTALAARSSDQSRCDYYSEQRYGESNRTTQLRLMQSIITLAYVGGEDIKGASKDNTGIFNRGEYNDHDVYLRPYFDGSKATTNINDSPAKVDWLDGGSVDPLKAFLNGTTDEIELEESNQSRLFGHWFTAFGFIYGCSEARTFASSSDSDGPRLQASYIHKYMDLNQTHLGYFIDQLVVASKHFGFSEDDANYLGTYMNARYNVRCAPADDGQLYSLCLADECPLAQPSADCRAYQNIQATGINTDAPSSTAESTTAATSSSETTTAAPASTDDADGSGGGGGGGSDLSGGAIAGIVIGSVAVALIAVGLFLFFRRRRSNPKQEAPSSHPSYASPQFTAPPSATYSPNPHSSIAPSNPHDSYLSGVNYGDSGYYSPKPAPQEMATQPVHEMDSNAYVQPSHQAPSLDNSYIQSQQMAQTHSPQSSQGWIPARNFGSPTDQ